MRPEFAKTAIILIFSWLHNGAAGNSVEQKIYVELNHTVPCVRLLNATHQIGCQSSISGDTGVIHVLEAESDVDWVLSSGPNPPYMVLMEANFFNRATMMRMKGSPRVAGVAVVIPKSGPPQGFSPHNSCPNEGTGVYSDSYGPELAGCNSTVWNPLGNSLSYENFNFPVFSLNDDNETEVIRKCFREHNVVRNGSSPQYPLCAMQLYSHMHAATDTVTCMRRNNIQNSFSVTPEVVCDAINDYNVWGSVHPLNSTAKGHKKGESVVIAAARIDGRSFFWDVAPSGEGAVAGFVTLLAAAHALRQVAPPTRNILYTFFQGETFDYIGSSRMVYDMENGKFVIDLDNIHSLLEIGQVGLRSGSRLWLHSDPVSRRRNSSVDAEVEKLVSNLQSVAKILSLSLAEPNVSQPLPPSSFQRFLRARPIPGVVLADHQSAFNNRYYESVYDTAEYLRVTYPPGLTPEEQLEYVTDVARDLAEVATLVARSLYLQANGSEANLPNITADPKTVTHMLYGFLVQSNNSWFQALTGPDGFTLEPLQYYVGVSGPPRPIKLTTRLVQYVLAHLTGNATNLTQSQCQNPENLEGESKELWSYLWVRGSVPSNSSQGEAYCVRAPVRLSKAVSPAFELQDYGSQDYSTWTESRWKLIRARIFLVASRELEMLTLGVGVAVLLVSLLVTYFISSKADLLFTSSREPASTTY
ncbi:nicastrin [Megalops cyprinoides]|uniref:nicastrin n=1 Tax=Megalops cyprinoides TaxID=118141 RepID=UPI001865345D|nr:nicastrin [Megalops cyprinoides]